LTVCRSCGNNVPNGEYCGACGAHLGTNSVARFGAFAADPGQHVLQPDIISTLFPHLPHRQSTPFRLALLVVVALLVVLGALRLTGPSIAVAAAGIPLLYLLYLYEVDVYEQEPVRVVGLTFVLGILLGIPWALWTGPFVTRAVLHGATTGSLTDGVLTSGVLIPLGAQVLMLAGPVILYFLGRQREPLDGFTFGVACALGFTLATTVVNLAPEMQRGLVGGTTPVNNALIVIGRGLLIPFLNASSTGLLAGAWWLRRASTRKLSMSWAASLPVTIVVAFSVRVVMGIIGISVLRAGVVFAIYAVIAALLVLWVRVAIHFMLLTEAEDATVGPMLACCNCHRVVPRMVFCTHCGIATGATPKLGTGATRRGSTVAVAEAGAPVGEGFYELASREQVAALSRAVGPPARWSTVGGTLIVGALALGVIAFAIGPTRKAPCGALCIQPPPPCSTLCTHASQAPPLQAAQRYTSPAYHFSVEYQKFSPSSQTPQSVIWDLSSGAGQYTVGVVADRANRAGSQEMVDNVVNANFPDFTHVYDIPGAEVGYVPGSGAVYEYESVPTFGQATFQRLVVLAAVQNGLAISVAGAGDAPDPSSSPNPSDLPVSQFIDTLTNGTVWPGQTIH
jgi:RsiW-degrading membrane proteinase PrsW (M82 family)